VDAPAAGTDGQVRDLVIQKQMNDLVIAIPFGDISRSNLVES
jgi:hypothetical protein